MTPTPDISGKRRRVAPARIKEVLEAAAAYAKVAGFEYRADGTIVVHFENNENNSEFEKWWGENADKVEGRAQGQG